MTSIADFFGCCSKEPKEKQITFTIQERRRAHSENSTRTARIKRSLGKSPKTHEQDRPSSNHTYLTLTCCSKSSKLTGKRVNEGDGSSILDHSYQEKQSFNRSFTPSKGSVGEGLAMSPGQKIKNFINYNNYCNSNIPKSSLLSQDQLQQFNLNGEIEMPTINTSTPRLLLHRRQRKVKEQEGISLVRGTRQKQCSILTHTKSPVIPSKLEPIEERLSVPSCSQSQVHDLIPNHSLSALNRINQSRQKIVEPSPMSQKYRSCTYDRDMTQISTGFNMARSENIISFEQKLVCEHQELVGSKVKIDIQIYQKELRMLMDEEKILLEQAVFSRQSFKDRISRLDETKRDLMQKMEKTESSLKEMIKLAKGKGSESGGRQGSQGLEGRA